MTESIFNEWLIRFRAQCTHLSNADVVIEYAWSKTRNVVELPSSCKISPPDLRYKRCCRWNRCCSSSLYKNLACVAKKIRREDFVTRSLRCAEVYDDYILKGIFIKGLHESVRHRMRSHWGTHPEAALYDLDRHETSLELYRRKMTYIVPRKGPIMIKIWRIAKKSVVIIQLQSKSSRREVVTQQIRLRRRQTLQR